MKVYSLLVLLSLAFVSCTNENQYCVCIDENLAKLKAYRLKGYQGKMKELSPECKELLKKPAEEIMKIKGDDECPMQEEFQKENRLFLEHMMMKTKELEQMGKNIEESLKDFKPLKAEKIVE